MSAATVDSKDAGLNQPEVAVRLAGIVKSYQEVAVLRGVSLEVRRDEFFSLLGPSGCGKTTLLRVIAGLTAANCGVLEIMGRDVTFVEPERRNIGMVFQNYALFPHMTVRQNVGFGLRMRRVRRAEADRRIAEALELVRLGGLGDRHPTQLSGGQQQRVALARALVIKPELLLLDEPLSNLDAKLRKSMQIELRNLQRQVGITTIYVTHDQEEALTLSDRVAVMNAGRVAQLAAPVDIYQRPADGFVAGFIGKVNVLFGRPVGDAGALRFQTEDGAEFPLPASAGAGGRPTHLVIRPEAVRLAAPDELGNPGHANFHGRIAGAVYAGAITQFVVLLESGASLSVEEQNAHGAPRFSVGDKVALAVDPATIWTVSDVAGE